MNPFLHFTAHSYKDIIIPGYVSGVESLRELSIADVAQRQWLLYFRGKTNSKIRKFAVKHFDSPQKDVLVTGEILKQPQGNVKLIKKLNQVFFYFLFLGARNIVSYRNEMVNSVFCLVMRGLSPWTLRLFEVFYSILFF